MDTSNWWNTIVGVSGKAFWWGIRMLIVWTLSLAIWPVISGAIMLVTGMPTKWAVIIGLLAFCVVFPTFMLRKVIIYVKGNKGVVLQNQLLPSREGDEGRLSVDPEAIPHGQRAVFSGLSVKYPWEVPIGDPIDLITEVLAVNTFVLSDVDGKRWEVSTTVPLTPLGGQYLCRFPLSGDEAAKAFFGSSAQNCVRAMFSKHSGKDIQADIEVIAEPFFKKVFGGTETVPNEKRYGRFTNVPFISNIKSVGDDQEFDQVEARIRTVRKAFKELAGDDAVMDPRMASNIIASVTGEDIQYVAVSGLENGGSFYWGGNEAIAGRGNKSKKDKGGDKSDKDGKPKT